MPVSKDGCDIIATQNYVHLGANIDNNLLFDFFSKINDTESYL